MTEWTPGQLVALKIDGKRWSCPHCRANVQTTLEKPLHYGCNGCQAVFIGDR